MLRPQRSLFLRTWFGARIGGSDSISLRLDVSLRAIFEAAGQMASLGACVIDIMDAVDQKTLVERFTFAARNLRSRELFRALQLYCSGAVLDVGGRDFYSIAKARHVDFVRWTNLEYTTNHVLVLEDAKLQTVLADGCYLPFENDTFDTILNIQVLEHVLDPIRVVREMSRVLKPGGHGLFLIPQTSVPHELPYHYYNLTRFWIQEATRTNHFDIVELKPLGGVWSTMASHLVYFFFQSARVKGYTVPECKRNALFYVFYPFMVLYALVHIPICLLFSLGDLTENPNNHLVVVKKQHSACVTAHTN